MNATSTHETISSSIEAPLLLSGANYWAHRFRLRQQSDASSHSSDRTVWLVCPPCPWFSFSVRKS